MTQPDEQDRVSASAADGPPARFLAPGEVEGGRVMPAASPAAVPFAEEDSQTRRNRIYEALQGPPGPFPPVQRPRGDAGGVSPPAGWQPQPAPVGRAVLPPPQPSAAGAVVTPSGPMPRAASPVMVPSAGPVAGSPGPMPVQQGSPPAGAAMAGQVRPVVAGQSASPAEQGGARERRGGGRRARRRKAAAPKGGGSPVAEQVQPQPWRWRRSDLLARLGLYAPQIPGIPSTTRQSEVLCTAISAPPTRVQGIINGLDLVTGQPVHHDPFTAYDGKIISSPNVVVLGDLGKGKSSLLKTVYVLRALALRKRRAVVADRKDQSGEGEYGELCRRLGGQPIKLTVGGGGSRINLLDPVIGVAAGDVTHVAGQLQLLRAVVHAASGQEPDAWEGAALRAAHLRALAVAEREDRVAVIDDVIRALKAPQPGDVLGDTGEDMAAARERFALAALAMSFNLERLVSDDLAGLFDGPTSSDVVLSDRLTSFDLSQLPTEGPALPLVMTVINTWLTNLLRRDRGWLTTFVAEEGWHLAEGVGARIFQRNSKLSRGIGLSNAVALHHLSDIRDDSPAIAMLKEAETIYMYAQAREDDARRCVALYSLPDQLVDELMALPQGVCLLKIGSGAPIMMQHLRSNLETRLTNTDAAMQVASARGDG